MKDKLSRFSLWSVGIIAGLAIFMISVKYVIPVLLPFIIAWLVATVTKNPAERLSMKTGISKRVLRLVISLLIVITIVLVVGISIWQICAAVWRFLGSLEKGNRVYDMLLSLTSSDTSILGNLLPEELSSKMGEVLSGMLSSLFSRLAESITALAGAIPKVFFFLLVTVISLVYFALDYDRIKKFACLILPENVVKTISGFCDNTVRVIGKYICSYSIILLITYCIMLIGFLLLSVRSPAIVALVVALLDILPVIGVGTVLIPWGIFEIATGNNFLGIGLLLLFVVNAIIRQMSEPKIVGKSLNLHPIITLILIYVGYALFGIIGLFLLPVLAVSVSIALKDQGTSEIG